MKDSINSMTLVADESNAWCRSRLKKKKKKKQGGGNGLLNSLLSANYFISKKTQIAFL